MLLPETDISKAIKNYLQQGQLYAAIDFLNEHLKKHPGNSDDRALLAALLCFTGDLTRADKQLEIIEIQDKKTAIGVALLRQLIRALYQRQLCFNEGAMPEFRDVPSNLSSLRLQALTEMRAQQPARAKKLLNESLQFINATSGTCNGKPFHQLLDIDDFCMGIFEALTSNGKYYWIGNEQIISLTFSPIKDLMDLLWRRAHIILRDGLEGEIYIPAIYVFTSPNDEAALLGDKTEWSGTEDSPVYGIGQRTFLIDENDISLREIEEITFNHE